MNEDVMEAYARGPDAPARRWGTSRRRLLAGAGLAAVGAAGARLISARQSFVEDVHLNRGKPRIDVAAYGADATENTAAATATTTAIQNATNAAAAAGGGTVHFPPGKYVINGSITLPDTANILWQGSALGSVPIHQDPAVIIQMADSTAATMVDYSGTNVARWTCKGIGFQGSAVSGNKGIHLKGAQYCLLEQVSVANCGDQCLHVEGGDVLWLRDCLFQGLLAGYPGTRTHSGTYGSGNWIGVIDTYIADEMYDNVEVAASIATTDGVGNICGIVTRGANGRYTNVVSEFNQVGWVFPRGSDGFMNTLHSCRSEFNNCQGFEIETVYNNLIGCQSYRNSQLTNGGYPGFNVTDGANSFVSCRHLDLPPIENTVSYGFQDSSGISREVPNYYIGCWANSYAKDVFNFAGTAPKLVLSPTTQGVQYGWNGTGTHVTSAGPSPRVAVHAGAGTGATVTLDAGSTDVRGRVNLNTGTSPAPGSQFTLTYANAYASEPSVVLTPYSAYAGRPGGAQQPYIIGSQSDGKVVTVGMNVAPVANQTYTWNYLVVG